MGSAQRHANADFPNAAAHSVGKNPIDSDRGKDKSQPGKCAKQEQVETLGGQRCGDETFHGNHVHHRQLGSHAVHGTCDGGNGSGRIRASAHRETHSKGAPRFPRWSSDLAQWPVEGFNGTSLSQRILLYVANASDNLSLRFPKKCQSDMLTDRIFVGPKTLGHGFTDEHYGWPTYHVGIIQVATAPQRDAHSAQVAW